LDTVVDFEAVIRDPQRPAPVKNGKARLSKQLQAILELKWV
jgi:hypothetical protein